MAIFKFRLTATAQPKLSIRAVLDDGLIIYAKALDDGVRTVSFDHPLGYFDYSYADSTAHAKLYALKPYHGKGANVEKAFQNALIAFNGQIGSDKINRINRAKVSRRRPITSNLDRWLIDHKGSLRAVMDIDGSILCTLEGYGKSGVEPSAWITVNASGPSFITALNNAFEQIKLRGTTVTHIKIKG